MIAMDAFVIPDGYVDVYGNGHGDGCGNGNGDGYGDGYGYGYGIDGAALVGERGNRFDAEEIDEDQGRDQAGASEGAR